MSMWEPFSEPARRVVVRAQEVAQMFGANFIGNEHLIFALAEGDGPVAAALVDAVDRDAIRERLGDVTRAPSNEMVFTAAAKQSIELAFENARRLGHEFIGTGHLALGILGSSDPPPLLAGRDVESLRAALALAASHDRPPSKAERDAAQSWKRTTGAEPDQIVNAVFTAFGLVPAFGKPGTRITVTVNVPDEPEQTWTWSKEAGG